MLATKRYPQALALASESARILGKTMTPEQWQMAAAMNVEGAALTRLGRYAEAEKLLLASQPALGNAPIPDLEQRGRARLVDLYTAWGRPEEARKFGPTT
jgi:hypothetical protein